MKKSDYDICIVGGAGHIGVPLALVLANCGFRVLLYDLDQGALDQLARGQMPFLEEGAEELLRRILPTGHLGFTTDPADLRGIPDMVLTIGTPVDEFHHPVTRILVDCVDRILPYLDQGTCLILRSTVAPGSTEFLDRHLQKSGKSMLVAFCPERITQGNAIKEIRVLAQIVSGTSPEAVERVRGIFGKVAPELVEMSPLEAEYAKLICNAYRYIQFAASNQLYMMVESAGLDYHRLLEKLKQGYPRMANLPRAGFAGGPCLMKDTMQLFASHKSNAILGQVAMTINEGMPDYLVSRLSQTFVLKGKRIGILGMAFKAESDDIRGSLSYRLGKILRFRGAEVSYSDEYVVGPAFVAKEKLVAVSDIIIIAVPHAAYKGLEIPEDKVVVDVCGAVRQVLQKGPAPKKQ